MYKCYIYTHQYRNKYMHLLHLEMDREGVGVERGGGDRSFTLLILCTATCVHATVQAYTLQLDTIYLGIGLYNLCITVHDCNGPWMDTTHSEVSRYFSAEHILQRCPLLQTARTKLMCGQLQSSYTHQTLAARRNWRRWPHIFILQTGLSVLRRSRGRFLNMSLQSQKRMLVQNIF